jgi:hypothetical protein
MFMNYQQEYNNLISFAKSQNRKKLKATHLDYICYDNHHIVPEHFYINRNRKGPPGWLPGNPEDRANKVLLTPEEHFDAHILLALIHPNSQGLLTAVIKMSGKFAITRKEFGDLKRKFCEEQSKRVSGEKSSFYGKHFDKSGENNPMFGRTGTNNPKFGIPITDEVKIKMSIGSMGKNQGNIPWNKNKTKETDNRLKKIGESISKALTGKPNIKLSVLKKGQPNSRSRKVRCIELDIIFNTYKEAADYVGLKTSSDIWKAIKRKSGTAKGYHWEFI